MHSFLDDAKATRPKFVASAFFAHEYNLNRERNRTATEMIAAVTGCECNVGLDFTGALGTQQIIDGILRSSWFIADFASQLDTTTGRIKLNINSCIEAGIAIGAGFGSELNYDSNDRSIFALFRESESRLRRRDVCVLGVAEIDRRKVSSLVC